MEVLVMLAVFAAASYTLIQKTPFGDLYFTVLLPFNLARGFLQ